jgi:hypothetical protein
MTMAATAAGLALTACSTSTPTAAKDPVTKAARSSGATATFLASLGPATQLSSTVPPDGDVNPYGIAVVPATTGNLVEGATLVSNFNDKANTQGTGTTIVEITAAGKRTTFAHLATTATAGTATMSGGVSCPGGIGLSTALAILPGGFVVVGSFPAGPGGALPAQNPAGCLLVLNSSGQPVATWTSPDINGPWDMTATVTPTGASLFVADDLSRAPGVVGTPATGLCSVVRIDLTLPSANGPSANGSAASLPVMTGSTVIGSGFPWRANKAAFIQGPTGLAFGPNGTLYVAETITSDITAIANALTRTTPVTYGTATLTSGGSLNGPLGLTVAPDGNLLAVNGNNGKAIEITRRGQQITTATLVAHGAGDLFGLTPTASGDGLLFVNDGTNALDVAQTR